MRLPSIAIATALVGICGGPALAGECPMLQAQMECQVNNRFDSAAYTARENMKQASALHSAGKHAESWPRTRKRPKGVGVTLDRKK